MRTRHAIAALILAAGAACADDITWRDSTSGLYHDPDRWDPQGVPTATDTAHFLLGEGNPYIVSFEQDASIFSFLLHSGTASFSLAGHEYAAEHDAIVGAASDLGELTVRDGTLTCGHLVVAPDPASNGRLSLSAATLAVGSEGMYIGAVGGGTLDVAAGSTARGDFADLGEGVQACGTLIVQNAESSFDLLYDMTVGRQGAGVVRVLDGGSVSVTRDVYAGNESSASQGLIEVDASAMAVQGTLFAGHNGSATMDIGNGGSLVVGQDLRMGVTADGMGVGWIHGAGTTADIGVYSIVAEQGVATLSVTDSAALRAQNQMTVAAASSAVGYLYIESGGTLVVGANALVVGDQGLGTMHISSGGAATCEFADIGVGIYPTEAMGGGAGFARVEGEGSLWHINNDITIGRRGIGTLEVADLSRVTVVRDIYAGNETSDAQAMIRVSSGGTLETVRLFAGVNGSATLEVSNGGVVECSGRGLIGFGTTSVGAAAVTGLDSQWWMTNGQLIVGNSGQGQLQISDSGLVSSTKGPSATGTSGVVAVNAESVGTVAISSGGQWTQDGSLTVGWYGAGLMEVDGGAVQSASGFIARYPLSTGTVTISAPGGNWTLSDSLYVGGDASVAGGTGLIQVSDSGRLVVTNLLKVWNDGQVHWNGTGKISAGSIELAGGGVMGLEGGMNKVLHTTALAVDVANLSQLDLADNAAIVDYITESPANAICSMLQSGYAEGAWNGPGIASSTAGTTHAIGMAEASELFGAFPASFMGREVDATAVLLRFTLRGDANLDAKVDTLDFNDLAGHFGENGTGTWRKGDFNYDTFIDSVDFDALVANFGGRVSMPTLLGTTIPEPLGMTMFLLMGVLIRRRRAGS